MTRRVTLGESKASPDSDGPNRGEELFGRVVLEDEATRPDPERLVDVLVEVEGRQDQDADASSAARIRRVASRPSNVGIRMSINTTSGETRGLLEASAPSLGLGDDLDPLLVLPGACGSPRAPSIDRRRRARESSSVLSMERQACAEQKSAAGECARAHLSAVDLDPLANAEQAVTTVQLRRRGRGRRPAPRAGAQPAGT